MSSMIMMNDATELSDALPTKPPKVSQSSSDFVYNYPRLNLNNLNDPKAIEKLFNAYEN